MNLLFWKKKEIKQDIQPELPVRCVAETIINDFKKSHFSDWEIKYLENHDGIFTIKHKYKSYSLSSHSSHLNFFYKWLSLNEVEKYNFNAKERELIYLEISRVMREKNFQKKNLEEIETQKKIKILFPKCF